MLSMLLLTLVDLKQNAQYESCELSFNWGKMRTVRPGDSTSDSSEKLLQRGRDEKGQYICDFW